MHLNSGEFSKLTTLMFAASLDQRKWFKFLEYLAQLTGVRVHMFGHDFKYNMGLDLLSTSYSPEYVKSYNEYYAPLNTWAPGFFKHQTGAAISSEMMCPRSDLEKSEFYNDWIQPQEDIVAGGGVILFKENSRMFVIGGNIRRKDEHIEQDWLRVLRAITPHLQNTIAINREISAYKIGRLASNSGVHSPDAAIFVVNGFRQILFANDPGNAMLDNGQVVRADIARRLEFQAEFAVTEFQRAIFGLNQMDTDVSGVFETPNCDRTITYSCRTMRFNPGDHDISPFGILASIQEPCLLLIISENRRPAAIRRRLAGKYSVTPAEADVILEVANGVRLREISDERAVSVHTVRNQLKSAMSKMGVHSQVALVRLVNELARNP